MVIDNTNPAPAARAPLIEIARSYDARVIGYFFTASVKQALERNQQREGAARVPPVAIYSTAAKLVPPAYTEGLDNIYYVRIAESSTLDAPAWEIEEMQDGEQRERPERTDTQSDGEQRERSERTDTRS